MAHTVENHPMDEKHDLQRGSALSICGGLYESICIVVCGATPGGSSR